MNDANSESQFNPIVIFWFSELFPKILRASLATKNLQSLRREIGRARKIFRGPENCMPNYNRWGTKLSSLFFIGDEKPQFKIYMNRFQNLRFHSFEHFYLVWLFIYQLWYPKSWYCVKSLCPKPFHFSLNSVATILEQAYSISFFVGRCRPRPAEASRTSWSRSRRRWRACPRSSRWRSVRSWASSRWRWRRWSRRLDRWPRRRRAVERIWATSNLLQSGRVRRNKREKSLSSLRHFK